MYIWQYMYLGRLGLHPAMSNPSGVRRLFDSKSVQFPVASLRYESHGARWRQGHSDKLAYESTINQCTNAD
jgi:hypothetical protein